MTGQLPTGTGATLAALACAGIAVLVVELVRAVRGVPRSPLRRPSRVRQLAARFRSRPVQGRLAAALAVGVVVTATTGWPVAGLGLGALVAGWPWLFGGAADERAQIVRLEALAIWTESLRDTVRGHAGLEQAIPVSAVNAPLLLRPALSRLAGRLRARVPLDAALLRLAADLDDGQSADPIIAALILHARRRGDRLADVLSGLASSARAELDQRRTILAGRAELRRGVQVIVGLTLAMAGYLALFNPTFTRPYGTPVGQVALAVVLGVFAAALAWLRRLARPEPVAEFLPRPDTRVDSDTLRLIAALTVTPGPGAAQSGAATRSTSTSASATASRRRAHRAGWGEQR